MSKTAFITGASSGIGAEFARQLAGRGYDLVIHGRRKQLLDELAADLKNRYGVAVEIEIAELSDKAQVERLCDVISSYDDLEMLVNNAGYTTRKNFNEESLQSQLDLIDVHLAATVALTHKALDVMLRKNKGYVINVASVAGFFASPRSALYCATKAFLNVFTESLYLELADTAITVQALCPGYTLSDFHTKLGYDKSDSMFDDFMTSEFVVAQSLKDLDNGKLYSIAGWKYRFLVRVSRFIPKAILHRLIVKVKSKRHQQ